MPTHLLPNPPELTLLKALWHNGEMPARVLHDACKAQLNWTFSSTRKTLQRMETKGFVVFNKKRSPARYVARVSKTATLAKISRDFMGRVLETESAPPPSLFTHSKILSDEELDELEGLLGN